MTYPFELYRDADADALQELRLLGLPDEDFLCEVTETGERRLLYHLQCYELIPVDDAPPTDVLEAR